MLPADMHRGSHRARIRAKVWVEAQGRFAVGDGGVGLLRAVEATGSVRAAADRVGWSYRHALAYISNMEEVFSRPMVERVRGGNERGGARLTARARRFVRQYSAFRRRAELAVSRLARTTLAGVL